MPSSHAIVPAALTYGAHGALQVGVLLCVALAALWLARRAYTETEPALTRWPRLLLTLLRAGTLLAVVWMLAEPVLHRESVRQQEPTLLLLVDDSASMQVRSEDGSTRWERAKSLRREAALALRGRREEHRVLWGEGSRRLGRSAASEGPEREAIAEGTDLSALVLSAAQKHLEDHLVGVLLLSDGTATSTRSVSLAGLDLPVWTLAVGDSTGPTDLRLDRVRHPRAVQRGDRVVVDAEVVVDAADAGRSAVVLEREGVAVDSLEVSWPPGGGRLPLQFVVTADSVGLSRGRIVVRGVDGEAITRNNVAQIGFDVSQERLRVVHAQQRPSWDFRFLAQAVNSDPRFEFVGLYNGSDGLHLAGTDSNVSWPLSAEDAREVDLWSAGSLGDLDWMLASDPQILESVRAGAGLLVLAGPGTGRPAVGDRARALLPIQPQARAFWRRGEVRAEITPRGRSHPVFLLPPALGEIDDALLRLPPLSAYVQPVAVPDDAEVLLRGRAGRTAEPILAVREEGKGRVAAFTGAPLWSWAFWRLGEDSGDAVHQAWLQNLLAYLAEGGERSRLRVFLPAPVVAQGEEALVEAVALDARLRPDHEADVWLEWQLRDESEAVRRARMDIDSASPGGRSLPLPALPAGDYRMRAVLESGTGSVESAWQPLTVDPYSVEFRSPGVDHAALAELARRTGGRSLTPDEIAAWAAEVPLEARQTLLTGRLDLWASGWTLLVLLSLLAAEWSLRKRWGLL